MSPADYAHLFGSIAMSGGTTGLLRVLEVPEWVAFWIGLGASFGVGLGKELIHDLALGYGTFDGRDLVIDGVGSVIGALGQTIVMHATWVF